MASVQSGSCSGRDVEDDKSILIVLSRHRRRPSKGVRQGGSGVGSDIRRRWQVGAVIVKIASSTWGVVLHLSMVFAS